MIEFFGLRPKPYAYLMGNDAKHKKVKGTKIV